MTYDEQDKRIDGIFGTKLAHHKSHNRYSTLIKEIHKRMHDISSITTPHLSIAGLSYGNWYGAESGMLSYPNYDGISKALDNPDIVLLSSLAESSKLDLRILVLYRTDTAALLSSYTKRFQMNWYEESLIMINSLAVLHSQLILIDKKFIKCIHFEAFTGRSPNIVKPMTISEKNDLINFIHPDVFNDHVDIMWSKIVSSGGSISNSNNSGEKNEISVNNDNNLQNLHSDYLLWRLQRQMSLIQSYCENV